MKKVTSAIPLRMTVDEREFVKREAAKDGVSFAEWIRSRINAGPLPSHLERIESKLVSLESILADIQRRINEK